MNGRPNPVTGRGAVVEGGTYVGRLPVKKHSVWGGAVWNEDGYMPHTKSTDVKKRFFTFFYLGHVFTVLTFFLFSKRFYLKNAGKVQSGKHINKKHFRNNSNEIDL